MLEIRPVADRKEQEVLAARCHVPYLRDSLAYAVFDGARPAAICQFRYTPAPGSDRKPAQLLSVGFAAAKDSALCRLLIIGVMAFCRANGCTALRCADGLPAEITKTVECLSREETKANDW